eukprot:Blabericola_migrator_1__11905@NODE_726_length_6713_cov_131_507824_g522_i0_p2_GENE_NODE_726_length_6713_cov_131_507824_g522_i0NODE_726_length_6713_cov_131_507824_g522_i0_p2_ORF_typecomplete_len411_score32_48Galactosyl_T/PF01762_21/6_4e31_NODE_726_length_6713_cov_131_507824_g522_i052396471
MRLSVNGVLFVGVATIGFGLLCLTFRASNLVELSTHVDKLDTIQEVEKSVVKPTLRKEFPTNLSGPTEPTSTSTSLRRTEGPELDWPAEVDNSTWPLTPIIYNPQHPCTADKNGNVPKVIAAILTIPHEAKARKWVREEIALITNGRVRPVFPLGRPPEASIDDDNTFPKTALLHEAQEYDDLILGDFMESYTELPRKTILAFEWFVQTCADTVNWLMKEDLDVVMNWFAILKGIEKLEKEGIVPDLLPNSEKNIEETVYFPDKDPIWLGARWQGMPVIHDRKHRNYEDVPFDWFPPYVSGPAYLLNSMVARLIVQERAKHVRYYRNEDAMIGIILQDKVAPLDNPFTIVFPGSGWRERACGKPTASISECGCDWWTYHTNRDKQEGDRALVLAFECAKVDPKGLLGSGK